MSQSKRSQLLTRFLRLVGGLFLLKIVLFRLIPWDEGNLDTDELYTPENYSAADCFETQFMGKDTIVTQRSWMDYAGNDYCIAYPTTETQYDSSRWLRNTMYIPSDASVNNYWSTIYQNLVQNDKKLLKGLCDSLYLMAIDRELDRNAFADFVVSFVQDIPYSFVLPDATCYKESQVFDCVGNERFGLLGPFEFLHTLKGDCDTRTVLLYAIFKEFNYEPIIVNSWKYLHSMLLLDVASTGDHIVRRGKRFYFWETTATGWRSGELPPDMSDKKSWNIILE